MSYISVKEAIQGILSKSMDADEAYVRVAPEYRDDFQTSLAYVRERLEKAKKDEKEKLKTHKNGQWSLEKEESLSKPPVSEAQRKAMWAAAKGHSNLGIPKSVGKDFAGSDPGGKLPEKKKLEKGTVHSINTGTAAGWRRGHDKAGHTWHHALDEAMSAHAPHGIDPHDSHSAVRDFKEGYPEVPHTQMMAHIKQHHPEAHAALTGMKKEEKEFYDYESAADTPKEHQASAPRKYQGGDPRHATGIGTTRSGQVRHPAVSEGSGKLKMPHTGISEKGSKIRGISPFEKEEKEYKQVKVQMDSDTYEPQGKHQPVMESPKNLKKSWTADAQWTLSKGIKPGPTLDYSQFNKKPDYADIEAKAPTINYSKSPGVKPAWSGATDKAKETRARIDAEAHETAAETIARRQGKKPVAKNEGTNLDAPPAEKGRMTAKNEMMGYGPTGSPENSMTMSEDVEKGSLVGNPGSSPGIGAAPMMMSEKDEGSPEHEAKEKEKAKKIKDDAEYILDMHKGEHIGFDKLSGELQRKGHSKESSDAIAASIGRKKYGAHKMAEMAHKSEDTTRSPKSC